MASASASDGRTRDRVAQLLLERGSATAAELGACLGLSPAAIRKHLDAMLAESLVEAREVRRTGRSVDTRGTAVVSSGRGWKAGGVKVWLISGR